MWRAIFLAGLMCAACVRAAPVPDRLEGPPQRIVSLDYCADQYVLKMVEPDRILAVSADAGGDFSYMREAAAGVPRVRPRVEDVLMLKPDLVVRAFGGGPEAATVFERAGIPVLQVGWANDLDGVRRVTLEMADGLGAADMGTALVADMDARLAHLATAPQPDTILYMTPGGVTSGSGTLVDEMLQAAGLANYVETQGWQALPLEQLAHQQPDRVAYASFSNHKTPWSSARHPIARAQVRDRPTVNLQGAWTSCGGWYLVDAVEALSGEAGK